MADPRSRLSGIHQARKHQKINKDAALETVAYTEVLRSLNVLHACAYTNIGEQEDVAI